MDLTITITGIANPDRLVEIVAVADVMSGSPEKVAIAFANSTPEQEARVNGLRRKTRDRIRRTMKLTRRNFYADGQPMPFPDANA